MTIEYVIIILQTKMVIKTTKTSKVFKAQTCEVITDNVFNNWNKISKKDQSKDLIINFVFNCYNRGNYCSSSVKPIEIKSHIGEYKNVINSYVLIN